MRPRSLVIGTGFRKQFSIEIFEEFYHDFIEKNKYSHLSVAEVLTLDRKVPSLLPLVQSKSIKITGYSLDQLKNVTGDFHSPCAQKHLKIPGLSEPSLIIRGAEILVGKTVYPDTVSYTHLDVYKRQSGHSPIPGFNRTTRLTRFVGTSK